GVAVILLTVLVKVLLIPLTHKGMLAAENMKRLQPKMEAIKAKYPEDRERQNVEMMKLYQEEKVNPLGGCLPMLVQMPVWIALFTTLRNSYELYQEPFFSPMFSDLTAKDPTYLLPLLLGVTMVVTQMLQPQMMDAAQARMMTWFMPIFFTVIMLNYPAGLTLYIFTNNVLSILQQWALKKYLERKATGSPA
ncbi:MAG: rane protein insertase YidC, partial [Pseudomonadota bacterium]